MPTLSDSTRETCNHFLSGSNPTVGSMGERAHREELQAMELPWWKREFQNTREELNI